MDFAHGQIYSPGSPDMGMTLELLKYFTFKIFSNS